MKESLKNCLWDYNFSDKQIQDIFAGDSFRNKQWLFSRIIYNSTDKIGDLSLFADEDLKKLFDNFMFSERCGLTYDVFLALKNTMLNERTYIEKYQWKKL